MSKLLSIFTLSILESLAKMKLQIINDLNDYVQRKRIGNSNIIETKMAKMDFHSIQIFIETKYLWGCI